MEYVTRQIERKDLPCFIELCKKHADYEHAEYDAANKLELLENAIFSDQKKLHCFVLEYQLKLIGYFTYTFDFSTWEARTFLYLDCLYLEPGFRGMRIGETIVEHLKEVAMSNKCINIQLQTPIFNESAIKFYKRMGGTGLDKVRFFMKI